MGHAITVVGAGVIGLWQALVLARRGHRVRVFETSARPFSHAASAYAGTLLAPDSEFPATQSAARVFAREGLRQWCESFDCVHQQGSLVVANDIGDLTNLANQSEHFQPLTGEDISALEPDLGTKFAHGLMFENEAHVETDVALHALLGAVRAAGVEIRCGMPARQPPKRSPDHIVVDCRGLAAQDVLDDLRGVRGERVVLKTDAITLKRPVRLLHLRQPIYVVPWGDGHFMVGATMIESADQSEVSVKSALDLLAMAYHLHPAFGEAEIVSMGAGVRPAFPDNLPRVTADPSSQLIFVNGAYRHGFLLAPVLAEVTANFLDGRTEHPWLTVDSTLAARNETAKVYS